MVIDRAMQLERKPDYCSKQFDGCFVNFDTAYEFGQVLVLWHGAKPVTIRKRVKLVFCYCIAVVCEFWFFE